MAHFMEISKTLANFKHPKYKKLITNQCLIKEGNWIDDEVRFFILPFDSNSFSLLSYSSIL